MKILNGKVYFEKNDVNKLKKDAIFYCSHPDDKWDFLYSIDEEERSVVIHGINALANTIGWEFSSETAINLKTIQTCYSSLKLYSSKLMDYEEFKTIPDHQVTSFATEKYENWLKSQGNSIFYGFFTDYRHY